MSPSRIHPSDEFLRHAADCQQMAKFTRDPASRATWSRMAERWLHCAEVFESQQSATQLSKRQPSEPHRRSAA
jgi:hypothetical protein